MTRDGQNQIDSDLMQIEMQNWHNSANMIDCNTNLEVCYSEEVTNFQIDLAS